MSNHCSDCAEEADIPDCGHPQDGQNICHISPLFPCPNHFSGLNAQALCAALPSPSPQRSFTSAVEHLNSDGLIVSAWYTWMAMLGQFSVPPGEDREKILRRPVEPPEIPDDAPAYLRDSAPLVSYACRAAVVGDWDTAEATLQAAHVNLDGEGMMCFLKSIAASTHLATDYNPDCTPQHLALYHLFGSQVEERVGAEVLPYLANMAVGHLTGNEQLVHDVFEALLRLPSHDPLAIGASVVARTLAQITSAEVALVNLGGVPGSLASVEGMVDVERATEENTDRAVMAGVWTVRAAQAYARAVDLDDAIARVRGVAQHHGQPGQFVMDVVLAGTQMVAYTYAAVRAENGLPRG